MSVIKIELILGVACLCEAKETYIRAILTLDETHQAALMPLIEKVMQRNVPLGKQEESPNKSDLDNSFSKVKHPLFRRSYCLIHGNLEQRIETPDEVRRD